MSKSPESDGCLGTLEGATSTPSMRMAEGLSRQLTKDFARSEGRGKVLKTSGYVWHLCRDNQRTKLTTPRATKTAHLVDHPLWHRCLHENFEHA